jgi:hypothetical protein
MAWDTRDGMRYDCLGVRVNATPKSMRTLPLIAAVTRAVEICVVRNDEELNINF